MKYEAMIIGLDSDIEELVKLEIKGNRLTCFASVCPYEIEEGKSYQVELHIRIFDELRVEQASSDDLESINLIGGFHYSITGKLRDGKLASQGVVFMEDDDFSDIEYLDGQALKIDVDRLDVHFVNE